MGCAECSAGMCALEFINETGHGARAIAKGGWAAKELCEKGLKTLILERGRDVKHIKDYPFCLLLLDEFENVELYEGAAEEILPALAGKINGSLYMIVDPRIRL